uniref:uncharacterized protein LOC120341517 n=1 Tax=Styela clava TaxID=7725 RepID=UPI00193A2386|nr:uncharacterized protein LOC120341517 [Styela clava]
MNEEGYYEEPMKWTTNCRDSDAVYENESRSREDIDRLEPDIHLENSWSYCGYPEVKSKKLIFAFTVFVFLSIASLILMVQNRAATENESEKISKILISFQKNLTLLKPTMEIQLTTPITEATLNETCNTPFRDKCFRLLRHLSNITLSEAREGCRNINGRLANIYNIDHFIQISSLLKDFILPGSQTITAWTGMTVNLKTKRMILSDFKLAPINIPWYPGRQFAKKFPYLGMYIRSSTNLYARGMYDSKASERFQTAVCEIEMKPCSKH